jgi:hypothetical protein
MEFKKAYDSVRKEVLYNFLFEFDIPMQLVRLIKMCLTETYIRVRISKNLSDRFPVFRLCLKYAIGRVRVVQDGLKLNGTHQLVVYADDVNILG